VSRNEDLSLPVDVNDLRDLNERLRSSDDVKDDGVRASESVEDRASRVEGKAFHGIWRRR